MEEDRKKLFSYISYFTPGEWILWGSSVILILASFLVFGEGGELTLIASLIGVTSLIFNAKGNPFGQILMIVFSVFYGIISFSFAYYGEMITYLGMTAPMSLIVLISWLRNPFEGRREEVRVNRIARNEVLFSFALTAVVTVIFYFILGALNTANLLPSTLSVTTSFLAVYLTFRRSPWFALAYAANDLVLIVLWVLASFRDDANVPVTVCFFLFLINDIYGFFSWLRMEKRQSGH